MVRILSRKQSGKRLRKIHAEANRLYKHGYTPSDVQDLSSKMRNLAWHSKKNSKYKKYARRWLLLDLVMHYHVVCGITKVFEKEGMKASPAFIS